MKESYIKHASGTAMEEVAKDSAYGLWSTVKCWKNIANNVFLSLIRVGFFPGRLFFPC